MKEKLQVLSVWKDIKEVASKELMKTPKIRFTTKENNGAMYVETFYAQENGIITETKSDYIIRVNILNVMKLTKKFNEVINYDVTNDLIKCLLYHECRHIWQAEHQMYAGCQIKQVKTELQKKEQDANGFAVAMAKTKRQQVISTLLKAYQEGDTGFLIPS